MQLLVFEDEVAGEGRVVIEQAGVLAELNPHEIVRSHRQDDCLAARSVTSSSVSVYRHLTIGITSDESRNSATANKRASARRMPYKAVAQTGRRPF